MCVLELQSLELGVLVPSFKHERARFYFLLIYSSFDAVFETAADDYVEDVSSKLPC